MIRGHNRSIGQSFGGFRFLRASLQFRPIFAAQPAPLPAPSHRLLFSLPARERLVREDRVDRLSSVRTPSVPRAMGVYRSVVSTQSWPTAERQRPWTSGGRLGARRSLHDAPCDASARPSERTNGRAPWRSLVDLEHMTARARCEDRVAFAPGAPRRRVPCSSRSRRCRPRPGHGSRPACCPGS